MSPAKKPSVNRVWIELEYPDTKLPTAEYHRLAKERADRASKMLKRLGVEFGVPVFWFPDKAAYCFTIDNGGSYVQASDAGHWYNLDYFGRDETPVVEVVPIVVKLDDVMEAEPHVFVAEASDFGLKPGTWPDTLATELGNKQPFERVGMKFNDDGELRHVSYRQQLGCITLKLFND